MSASFGKSRANRLALAVLLLFFRANGRFPDVAELHPSVAIGGSLLCIGAANEGLLFSSISSYSIRGTGSPGL